MYRGDDHDALLFGSVSSQSSSEPSGLLTGSRQHLADARLFPESQSPASLTLQCRSSKGTEKASENEPSLQQNGVQQQPTHRHRHISLFASIDLIRPSAPLRAHEGPPSISASEQSQKLTALQGSELTNIVEAGPAVADRVETVPPNCTAYIASSTHCQVPKNDAPSLCPTEEENPLLLLGMKEEKASTPQQCGYACSSGLSCSGVNKPGELAPSFKSVEGCAPRSHMDNADAHRFVAQELQEIHRIIQARAFRLRQQEEETSAAVAQAANTLRQHAQQLLNQAGEKLERLATQQRKRTEAAAEKAATILRRVTEARCALRHERNMLEQARRRQGGEQNLKLRAATQALDAERRRCADLEVRLEALQQENRQLRAALRAQPSQARATVKCKQLGVTCVSSSNRRCPQALGTRPPTTRCTAQQSSAETASLTAVVVPAVPAAKAARGGCQSCLKQSGKTVGVRNLSTEAVGRPAIVDVEVRLPPPTCSGAPARPSCNEVHTHEAHSGGAEDGADRPQLQPQEHPYPPQADALPDQTGDTSNSKCPQRTSSARQHKHRNRSAGSSAFRTDQSTSSNGSMSSSNKLERRRPWRQRMQHRGSRVSRSVSRGSISTSSSSAAPERERIRRRSHSTRIKARTPQHHRISFAAPQPTLHLPLQPDDSSSSCSSLPRRARSGAHKLKLRRDVAGRLQESLMRLQERQALQGKIQNIAKQLLHPHQL